MAKPKIFTLIDEKLEKEHESTSSAHSELFSNKLDKTEYITIPAPTQDNVNKFLKSLGTAGVTYGTGTAYTAWEEVDALPSQASASGKFLTTNGTSAFWETVDVSGDIAAHNTSETAHTDIRAYATSIQINLQNKINAVTTSLNVHATSETAHEDIRAFATSIQTKIGTDIASHNISATAHADIRAFATSIKTSLDNYLLKTGGTVTGKIVTSVDDAFSKTNDNSFLSFVGGTSSDSSANIKLYGSNYLTGTSNYSGGFSLSSNDATSGTSYILQAFKNGSLQWTGNKFYIPRIILTGITSGTESGDAVIKYETTYKRLRITGGYDENSANLYLSGENFSDSEFPPNSFSLSSTNGTAVYSLLGKNDGSLTWRGDKILVANTGDFAAIGTALNIDNKLNLSHNTDTTSHADIRAFATSIQTKIGTDIASHNTSGTAHEDIRAFATSIKTTADAALPKAGGTMSGAIYTTYNEALFKTTNSTSLTIGGGNSYENGGAINLYGNSYLGGTSTVSGGFEFVSRQATASGTTSASLIGSNGAILWWSGAYIRGKMLMVTGSTSETVSDDIVITANTQYKRFRITNGNITSSANLFLSGQDYTNASFPPNSFSLTSTNGTSSYVLLGKNDGTLSWKGSRVLTTDDYSTIGTAIDISSKLDVSHNTDTTAHAYIQNAVATAQSKANSAYTTATSAYAIATAALPKAGGTLTGKVTGTITNADTATKVGSSTVGGTAKPVYINSGTPTAFSATIGGTDTPIYLNAGVLTSTGKKFSDYVTKSGNETVGGTKTFSDGLVATNVTLTNATVNGIKFVVDSDGKLSIEY